MKRGIIRTTHDDPELVAAALAPDDTTEMKTTADGATLTMTVERATTGGLRSTADDYLSNLAVAQQILTDTTYNNE